MSPMKAPGGALLIVGMVFALGGMISVMVGNLVFTASAPVPCLIISFISGIIASALAGAAWAKGNKGAKGILAWGIIDIVTAVVIGLMWATAFG